MRYVKEIIEGVPVWREAGAAVPEADELADCRLPRARRESLVEIVSAFEVSHTHEELMFLAGGLEAAANRKYADTNRNGGDG